MKTSRGEIFERISLIQDLECCISHDIESIIFLNSEIEEMENAYQIMKNENNENECNEYSKLIDKKIEQLKLRKKLLLEITNLRRDQMANLPLKEKDWCGFKHFSSVVVKALEIWQSTEKNSDFCYLLLAYRAWTKRISISFGIDYNECYRCLSDKLKEKNA